MKTVADYYARLNEIEQLPHMKSNQIKEKSIYKNLEIIKKQTFVADKDRK